MKNRVTNAVTVIDYLNNNPRSTLLEIQRHLNTHHGGSAMRAYEVISYIRWKIGKDVIPTEHDAGRGKWVYWVAASLSDILAAVARRHDIERSYLQHDQIMLDIAEAKFPGDPAVAEQRATVRNLLALLNSTS